MPTNGLLLSLENTQPALLNDIAHELAERGYSVTVAAFPCHDAPSSYFIHRYQTGAYGDPHAITPYTSSLFYALDRYEASFMIRNHLDKGHIVLSTNYVGSNMAMQGLKFTNEAERRGFFIWVDSLEYNLLGIPRPQKNIVLMPPEDTAANPYAMLCTLFPQDFTALLTRGPKDSATILEYIAPFLTSLEVSPATKSVHYISSPKETAQSAQQPIQGRFFIPLNVKGATKKTYVAGLRKICDTHDTMLEKLTHHLSHAHKNAEEQAADILNHVLPVSAYTEDGFYVPPTLSASLQSLSDDSLSQHYGTTGEHLQLTDVWPRRELDLAADALLPYTSASLQEIKTCVAGMKYDQLYNIITEVLRTRHVILQKAHYQWDVVTEYQTFRELQLAGVETLSWQPLSPRMGYDVPAEIDDADLTEMYESCFDTSMELYSQLQAAGHDDEAQYAVLRGHYTRYSFVISADKLQEIYKNKTSLGLTILSRLMHEKMSEVHPILGEALKLHM